MNPDMGDPTQQDPRASSGEPATPEQPGSPPPGPASPEPEPGVAHAAESTSPPDASPPHADDDADLDDDLGADDEPLDPAKQEEMIENLLARVGLMRRRWALLERERRDLGRALRRVERERDQYRAEHERALRRAEDAELRLAEVQARITALQESLQQRPRPRSGSAKQPGPGHDVGQDFK